MKRLLKYSLAAVLVLALNMAAHADRADKGPKYHPDHPKPSTAPEVDMALAVGGLALVGSTLTVLRARRRKQQ
jgi:LPXTG-motif cell wall-anchored protein